MTTASPITDIHKAEKAAKTKIEQAKEANSKKILKTREEEEEKLQKMEEELRETGKDQYNAAKAKATKEADDKLREGKSKNEAAVDKARSNKMAEAIAEGVKAFQEHISA